MTREEWLKEYHSLDAERLLVAEMFEAANVGDGTFERADTASFDLNEKYRDLAHVAAEIFEADHTDLLKEAQEAQDAAYGDSNDSEIDLLRGALETALGALGLALPEGHDPDDDDEDEA